MLVKGYNAAQKGEEAPYLTVISDGLAIPVHQEGA